MVSNDDAQYKYDGEDNDGSTPDNNMTSRKVVQFVVQYEQIDWTVFYMREQRIILADPVSYAERNYKSTRVRQDVIDWPLYRVGQ